MVMRVAGNKEGNSKGGKGNGSDDKVAKNEEGNCNNGKGNSNNNAM